MKAHADDVEFATSPLPLIVRTWEDGELQMATARPIYSLGGRKLHHIESTYRQRHYVWFFGLTMQLPYERSVTGYPDAFYEQIANQVFERRLAAEAKKAAASQKITDQQ